MATAGSAGRSARRLAGPWPARRPAAPRRSFAAAARSRWPALLLAALAAAGAAPVAGTVAAMAEKPAEAAVTRIDFVAFGSPASLQLVNTPEAAATRAVAGIRSFLDRTGRDWYAWGDGELARVNARLAASEPAPVSAELGALIARALALSAQSGGRFDPAVGDLVALWGFDREERLAATRAPPPAEVVAAARRSGGTAASIRLTGNELRATRPVRIDLGGIAKGTAVTRIAAQLRAAGIRNALIDLGGSSLQALGARGGRPWRVGLQQPRGDGVFAAVSLADGEALATSGDYERFFAAGGRRYAHVLDPRTGAPAMGAASATVISRDAELADAAATALLVGGPADFAAVTAAMQLSDALLVTADGTLLTTPAMAARLRRDNGGRVPAPRWPGRP